MWLKSLLGAQIPLGDHPLPVGPKHLFWGSNPYGSKIPSGGQALLLCILGGEANPFWSPNFACVSQTPHRTKTPFGVQALPVGPKTSVEPKSLLGTKPFV